MRYTLVTVADGERAAPAIQVGDRRWLLSDAYAAAGLAAAPLTLMDALQEWDVSENLIGRAAAIVAEISFGAGSLPPGTRILTPVQYPRKVVCSGTNYYDHLREMGILDFDKRLNKPLFFLKPGSTTLVGPGATAPLPRITKQYDWEIELAVVIGRAARNVTESAALDHVAAYSVGIDLTARDLQRQPETAFKFDWYAGKCCDGSCPLGPALVPARFVTDPQNLKMRLRLNGETMQNSCTSEMIFSVSELIAAASRVATLEPGDVLMTGTPAGVGWPKGHFLADGDTIVAEIEEVGLLEVSIIADRPA